MPSYVVLINMTEQGVQNAKNLRSHVQGAREAIQAAGGRLISYYLTMGPYDAVATIEVPDAATAARLALAIGARGNGRTTTMAAFTEEETWALVESLP